MKLSKINLLALQLFLYPALRAQNVTVNEYPVSGKVTQTSAYCGGARPSEEMMEQYSKPKPYPGKVFYVRKGNVNNTKKAIVLKFVSDVNGKFTFKLPPGVYSIIQAEQLKALKLKELPSNRFIAIDKSCLKEWWKKPYYLLEVKDRFIDGLDFSFHHPCFVSGDIPCMTYTGPMPP